MKLPALILKQLYSFGSLKNATRGISFELKNRLSDSRVVGVKRVVVNGSKVALETVEFVLSGETLRPAAVSASDPMPFPLRQIVEICCRDHAPLGEGKHEIRMVFTTDNFGELKLKVSDAIAKADDRARVPHDKQDDYSAEIIEQRQQFIAGYSGVTPKHTASYSFDAHTTEGNIEGFIGVAQVPLGPRARGGHLEHRQAARHRHLPGRQVRLPQVQL